MDNKGTQPWIHMWTIFKVFIEFVTLLLLFYIFVFWPEACGILAPQAGIEPTLPALEGEMPLDHQGSPKSLHHFTWAGSPLTLGSVSHLQGSRSQEGVSVLVSAVFPIRSHSQVHSGHEFTGTLFTPARYPGGHTLATCLHLGYQGAGIWVPLLLLTQVSCLEARATRWGFPPKRGMSGSLAVKKGRLFPTI